MQKYLFDKILYLFSKLKEIAQSNPELYENNLNEIKNYESQIDDVKYLIREDERRMSRFKVYNLAILIFPTIAALLLTCYVFYNNFKIQKRFKDIQNISELKDSVISLSKSLLNYQEVILTDTTIIKRGSINIKNARPIQQKQKIIDSLINQINARESLQE